MSAAGATAESTAVAAAAAKVRPNVLITGTPGTGKTTLSEAVAEATGMTLVNVGDTIRKYDLHDGYDKEWDTHVLNEDKLCDHLEETMSKGGVIVDFHTCDFFPERWFQLVIVLRADNGVLYERLQSRGYQEKKVMENVQAEIMQVVLDEARESYAEDVVQVVESDSVAQMEENVSRISQWYKQECTRIGLL